MSKVGIERLMRDTGSIDAALMAMNLHEEFGIPMLDAVMRLRHISHEAEES